MKQTYRDSSRYVYGNTAPKLEPAGGYQEKRRQEQSTRSIRRNRERALTMTSGYVAFLCLVTVMVFAACAMYVGLQADVNKRMSNITSMEDKIVTLKESNDATLKNLQTSVKLDEIRKTAVKKLGMVYPSEDQIVYYEVDKNDYMEQVDDIPDSESSSVFQLIFQGK